MASQTLMTTPEPNQDNVEPNTNCLSALHNQCIEKASNNEPFINYAEEAFMTGCMCAIELGVQNGQSINEPINGCGERLIHLAVRKENIQTIKLLVKLGAGQLDLDIRSEFYNKTAIHLAVIFGNVAVVELLVQLGSQSLNKTDYGGETCMHSATMNNNIEMVQRLISYGLNVDAKSNDNKTPLHSTIIWSKSCDILELLLINGSQSASWSDMCGSTPLIMAAQRSNTLHIETLVRFDNRVLDANFDWLFYCAETKKYGSYQDHINALITLASLFDTQKTLNICKYYFDCRGIVIDEDTVANVRFRVYFAHSLVYRLVIMANC
jgi:ankyrin repeat protein